MSPTLTKKRSSLVHDIKIFVHDISPSDSGSWANGCVDYRHKVYMRQRTHVNEKHHCRKCDLCTMTLAKAKQSHEMKSRDRTV